MDGSLLKFSLEKGFGESWWNICPVCGNASIRTVFWEDGTVEHRDCLVCLRMGEKMELEELLSKNQAEQ
jgi:Zn ribbon nucleic-acid-binding protein